MTQIESTITDVLNDTTAAALLGLKTQTMRNWRFLGKGPAYSKIGRRVIYARRDIEEYKNRNRIDPERR